MLKQNLNRSVIIDQFSELAELLYPNTDLKILEFRNEARDDILSVERAIYWYTVESPIYKTLNKLLRSSKNPT